MAQSVTTLPAGRDPEPELAAAQAAFPMRMPAGWAHRAMPGDPLWRQAMPDGRERDAVPGFSADPLAEAAATVGPGLIRKHPDRILLLVTDRCAVNCRFCFRRHGVVAPPRSWEPALDYIAGEPGLREVILSGGDPLMLSDGALARLAGRLGAIPHLRRLRIHTRMPVVVPERVTDALTDWLERGPLQPVLVIHVNHVAELDRPARAALERLARRGITLLHQGVLLGGVNDDAATLRVLLEELLRLGVLPYYLHLLDPVAGAAHFQVPEARAKAILTELRASLPGYGVPRLVRELPGRGKVPLSG